MATPTTPSAPPNADRSEINASLPSLPSLLRKLSNAEHKHGESSDALLPLISKVLLRTERLEDTIFYLKKGLAIATLRGKLDWKCLFLRRLARTEASQEARVAAGVKAVSTASQIGLSAAQNYAMCDSQISAGRAYLHSDDLQFDAHRSATSAAKLAHHAGARDMAAAQEVEARTLLANICLDLHQFDEARREIDAADQLITGSNDPEQPLAGWLVLESVTTRRRVLEAQGEYNEAKEVGLEVVAYAERIFGKGSTTATDMILEFVELVLVAGETKRVDPAGFQFDAAGFKSDLMKKAHRLNQNRSDQEQHYGIAIDLVSRAIGTYKAIHSEVSEGVVTAMGHKAELLSRVGRHREAAKVQGQAVRIARVLWGPDNKQHADEQLALTLIKRRGLIHKESYLRKEQQAQEQQSEGALSRWQMLEVELYRSCAFPFCSEVESDVTKFQACQACRGVSYCSQKCQMDHWHAGHQRRCGLSLEDGAGAAEERGQTDAALDETIRELTAEAGQLLEVDKIQAYEYVVRNRDNGSVVMFRILGRDMVLRLGRSGWMMFAESLPQLEELGIRQGYPEMDFLLDVNDYVVQAGDILGKPKIRLDSSIPPPPPFHSTPMSRRPSQPGGSVRSGIELASVVGVVNHGVSVAPQPGGSSPPKAGAYKQKRSKQQAVGARRLSVGLSSKATHNPGLQPRRQDPDIYRAGTQADTALHHGRTRAR